MNLKEPLTIRSLATRARSLHRPVALREQNCLVRMEFCIRFKGSRQPGYERAVRAFARELISVALKHAAYADYAIAPERQAEPASRNHR